MLAMLKPFTAQVIMITRSINRLNINAGIVIFVGSAARLVTNAIPIATSAIINKTRLLPALTTANMVNGVNMHPCPANAIPSHNRRFSCWFLHQFINTEIKEDLEML